MGSPKWFCHTLALLAILLVGGSFALECYLCEPNEPCVLTVCTPDFLDVCYSEYHNSTSKLKRCSTNSGAIYTIGGNDTCVDGVGGIEDIKENYKHQHGSIKGRDPNDPRIKGKTPEQFADEKWETEKAANNWGPEVEKGFRACACLTDGCNDDAYDQKVQSAPAPNKHDPNKGNGGGGGGGGSGGKGAGTTLLADSGNLGAVMFLALAVLAALVPGSGFRRSQ